MRRNRGLFFFYVQRAGSIVQRTSGNPFVPMKGLGREEFIIQVLTIVLGRINGNGIRGMIITRSNGRPIIFHVFLFGGRFSIMFQVNAGGSFPYVRRRFIRPSFVRLSLFFLMVDFDRVGRPIGRFYRSSYVL